MKNIKRRLNRIAIITATIIFLGGCAVGPDYKRPEIAVPANYLGQNSLGQNDPAKNNWVTAAPADALDRGTWWQLFNDPILNELQTSVSVSNQNIIAAKAAYDQARSLVTQQRAAIFPSVDLSGSADRTGVTETHATSNKYQVGIGASWEPDVWGRLSRATKGARAAAQATEADLVSAQLSAQGELAIDYFSLRETDAQIILISNTIDTYERSLQITQNRFTVGATTKTDVLQAQTQLANTKADLLSLQRQREQLEHAIAVLVGKTPEEFALAAQPSWQAYVPQVPLGLPSELLQRRPDIASAERRVAAANEQIGVAKSGYFPSLKLSASDGNSSNTTADLFNSNANVWSLGLSLAQTLFDAGATGARVDSAKAAHEQASAHYRQTVLSAFADVEDQLTAIRILSQQQILREQASQSADQVEQQALNRYRYGQISFTDVVSAQTSALSARRSLAQAYADSQTAAVALIQALGGGWQGDYK